MQKKNDHTTEYSLYRDNWSQSEIQEVNLVRKLCDLGWKFGEISTKNVFGGEDYLYFHETRLYIFVPIPFKNQLCKSVGLMNPKVGGKAP